MTAKPYRGRWFVYIAECGDGTLYVGAAKSVRKRIEEHNRTNKCRYTRGRKPVKLAYSEPCRDHGSALKREAQIKKLSRKQKMDLI